MNKSKKDNILMKIKEFESGKKLVEYPSLRLKQQDVENAEKSLKETLNDVTSLPGIKYDGHKDYIFEPSTITHTGVNVSSPDISTIINPWITRVEPSSEGTYSFPSPTENITKKDLDDLSKKIDQSGLKQEYLIYRELAEAFDSCKTYGDVDKVISKLHKKFLELSEVFKDEKK